MGRAVGMGIMTRKYVVRFEARNAGAIGVLSRFREIAEAGDHALAADKVRQGAYSRGLEHVHVLSVELAEPLAEKWCGKHRNTFEVYELGESCPECESEKAVQS